MQVVCAWCKEPMGTKEPEDDPAVTHSICLACLEKELATAQESG